MAFVASDKNIHCPTCHFEGLPKTKGSGLVAGIAGLLCLLAGIAIFTPLLVAAPAFWIYAIFKPARMVCPKCNEPTRVGIQREEGTARRVCKNCEALID